MSVNVAWFPDYGHIVAGIFSIRVVSLRQSAVVYMFSVYIYMQCFVSVSSSWDKPP